jgi:large subunit ribosomal protein L29
MKSKEIRELTDAELVSRIGELRREKLNLKIQLRTGQLEKTARCRTVRRDIARLLQEQGVRAAKAEEVN